MEFHYIQKIRAIKEMAERLEYLHSESSHEYWLWIDGDKLTNCERMLTKMVDDIEDEKRYAS